MCSKCHERSPEADGLVLEACAERQNNGLECQLQSGHDIIFHKVKISNRRIENCKILCLRGYYDNNRPTVEFKNFTDGTMDREWRCGDPNNSENFCFSVEGRRKSTRNAGVREQYMASMISNPNSGANTENIHTSCQYQFDDSTPQTLDLFFVVDL